MKDVQFSNEFLSNFFEQFLIVLSLRGVCVVYGSRVKYILINDNLDFQGKASGETV